MRQVVFVAGMLLCAGRVDASVHAMNLWQIPVILSARYFQPLPVPVLDLVGSRNHPNVSVVSGSRDTFNIFRKIREIEEKVMKDSGKLDFSFQSDSEKLVDEFSARVSQSSTGIGSEVDTKYSVASKPPGLIMFKGRKKKRFTSGGSRRGRAQRTSGAVSTHSSSLDSVKAPLFKGLWELLSIYHGIKETHYSCSHKKELDKFEEVVSSFRASLKSFDECFCKGEDTVGGRGRIKLEVVRELIVDHCQDLCNLDRLFIVDLKDQLSGVAIEGIETFFDLAGGTSSVGEMSCLRLLFPLMGYFEPFLDQMSPGIKYQQLFMTDTESTFLLWLSTDGEGSFDIWFFEGEGTMISDLGRVNKKPEFSVLLALMATINRKRNGRGQFYFLGRERSLDERLSLTMSVQDIVTICGTSAYDGVQCNAEEEVEVVTDINLGCEEFWREVRQDTTSSPVGFYSVKAGGSVEAIQINRRKRAVYDARLGRLISELGSPERGVTSLSSLKAFAFFKISHLPAGHLELVESEGLLENLVVGNDWTEEERAQITRVHLANCGFYIVDEWAELDIDERNAAVVNLRAEELRMEMYINLLRRLIQPERDQGEADSATGETSSACGDGWLVDK